MFTVHSQVFTVHSQVFTVHSQVFTVQSQVFTVHSRRGRRERVAAGVRMELSERRGEPALPARGEPCARVVPPRKLKVRLCASSCQAPGRSVSIGVGERPAGGGQRGAHTEPGLAVGVPREPGVLPADREHLPALHQRRKPPREASCLRQEAQGEAGPLGANLHPPRAVGVR